MFKFISYLFTILVFVQLLVKSKQNKKLVKKDMRMVIADMKVRNLLLVSMILILITYGILNTYDVNSHLFVQGLIALIVLMVLNTSVSYNQESIIYKATLYNLNACKVQRMKEDHHYIIYDLNKEKTLKISKKHKNVIEIINRFTS